MSLFSFLEHPFKPITRALGIPDKAANVIFPVQAVAGAATHLAVSKLENVIHPSAKQATFQPGSGPFEPGPAASFYQGQYAPPPAYSVYFADDSIYGGPKWDFSMDFWETSSGTSRRMSPGTSWGDYLLL
jgi:hypothetical protein